MVVFLDAHMCKLILIQPLKFDTCLGIRLPQCSQTHTHSFPELIHPKVVSHYLLAKTHTHVLFSFATVASLSQNSHSILLTMAHLKNNTGRGNSLHTPECERIQEHPNLQQEANQKELKSRDQRSAAEWTHRQPSCGRTPCPVAAGPYSELCSQEKTVNKL